MTGTTVIVLAGVALGLGTFGFRFAGASLKSRVTMAPHTRHLLAAASVILLIALVASSALLQDGGFAGWARPAGVAVGGVLAWRRAPFLVVVLAAAAVTAGLRLLGVR
jgi:branched-subunit amino acid transport protein